MQLNPLFKSSALARFAFEGSRSLLETITTSVSGYVFQPTTEDGEMSRRPSKVAYRESELGAMVSWGSSKTSNAAAVFMSDSEDAAV